MDYGILLFKGILNTLIRLTPLSLYMGSIMSSLMFDDKKANILLLGFILVEGLSGAFKTITNAVVNPQCALVKSETNNISLPAAIPTTIGFMVAFFICNMVDTETFNPIKFYFLLLLLILSIWSRYNVGCHSIIDSVIAAIIGIVIGIGYYNLVKTYYNNIDLETLKPSEISDNESKIYKILDLS
jgi:hypothetical protein